MNRVSFAFSAFQVRHMGTTGPLAIALSVVFVCAGCGDATRGSRDTPPSASDSLTGLWEVVASETLAPDGSATPGTIRESFLLFTPEHYSMNWVGAGDPVSSYED